MARFKFVSYVMQLLALPLRNTLPLTMILPVWLMMGTIADPRPAAAACNLSESQAIATKWQHFHNQQQTRIIGEEVLETRPSYNLIGGQILVEGHGKAVTSNYSYYRTQRVQPGGKAPLLFIYTGLGGESFFDTSMAEYFAERGVSVVVNYYLEYDEVFDIDALGGLIQRTTGVGLGLTDAFTARPEVDRERLGVFGVSYGGVRAYHNMVADPRLKAAVILVAGAPLEDILAYSRFFIVKGMRKAQMKLAEIPTIPAYRAVIRALIGRDLNGLPEAELACSRQPKDFYQIVSLDDDWAPTPSQWRLWDLLGRPRHEVYPKGHISTIAWTVDQRLDAVMTFLQQRWESP